MTAALASKQDLLVYAPVNRAGDTMTGTLAVNVVSGLANLDMNTGVGRVVVASFPGAGGTVNSIQSVNQANSARAEIDVVASNIRLTANASIIPEAAAIDHYTGIGRLFSGNNGGVQSLLSINTGNTAFLDYNIQAKNVIISNGNGGNTSINQGLTVGTTVSANTVTAVTVTQTSDARLKKDIQPIAPRDLSSIPYDSWSFIKGGSYGQGHVARDVEAKAPEFVHEFGGVKAVDQAGLALEKVAYIEAMLKRGGYWQ